jgi:hypothetical protein
LPVVIDDNGVVHLRNPSVFVSSRRAFNTNIRLGGTELELD